MKKSFLILGLSLVLAIPISITACNRDSCSHNQQAVEVVEPTCNDEGYSIHICEDCGAQYQSNFTAPNGHTLSEEVIPPTCTQEGYTVYDCECGYKYKGRFLEPIGHVYESTVVEPTCEEEGYTEHVCTVCAHTYISGIRSAPGHQLISVTVPATCVTQGYTEYHCERGDLTYRADHTEPLGHTMVTTHAKHPDILQAGRLTQQCLACEHQFTNHLLFSDVFSNAYVSTTPYLAKGIDVSYHNHAPNSTAPGGYDPLNWSAIKEAGFDFAILRAGYTGFKDPVFELNYADAKAAGINLGVYYYTYAKNVEQAREEAEELLSWLNGKQFEYPIYYDIEDGRLADLGRDTLTELCMTFVDVLREAGYYGAIYANENWLSNYLHSEELKGYCELWYARYQRDPIATSEAFPTFTILPEDNEFTWLDTYGTQVGLWQYTQCGVIEGSGMDQQVDMNYAFKDYPSLMKKLCLNGYHPVSI